MITRRVQGRLGKAVLLKRFDNRYWRAVALSCLLASLLGCKPSYSLSQPEIESALGTETASPDNTYVYQCSDNYHFVAKVEDDTSWLFLPGRTLRVALVKSASGARFESGSAVYWSKGEEATLIYKNHTYLCNNDRRRAVWEAAKLNGFDYRAVGNEPGWVLEIGRGIESRLMTDYGQRSYYFVLPEPVNDEVRKLTRYQVISPAIEIVIKNKPCADSMGDETYASAVSVKVAGKTYLGCGRTLH